MERPSHTILKASVPFSRRLPLLGLAASLQVAVVWLFTHGLATQMAHIFHPIDLVPVIEQLTPRAMPPPMPRQERPVMPKAVEPVFKIGPAPTDGAITIDAGPAVTQSAAPVTGSQHAPVGITATHTSPPYPPIARRLGAEGTVTLRLTVLANGRVGDAGVVTSSGRDELDRTAQQWIVAHWTYKPAVENGVPAVGHTLATVVFSLKN
ncbi:MAG TPA: energy transducer TonB [Rhizomicrobium sp.]|jgi:protein TonB